MYLKLSWLPTANQCISLENELAVHLMPVISLEQHNLQTYLTLSWCLLLHHTVFCNSSADIVTSLLAELLIVRNVDPNIFIFLSPLLLKCT